MSPGASPTQQESACTLHQDQMITQKENSKQT